jgi:LEA14-like dessication related protein
MKKLIALIAIPALLSCSSYYKYKNMQKPVARLDSVDVQNVDIKGAKVLFNVEVENPNDFAIKVDSVKYEVEIGGRKISTDSISTPTEVAGKTKSTVRLPLTLQFADVFSSIGDFLRNEKTTYRLKGAARVGIFSLPLDETGEFKLTEGKIEHSK